jgi:hypothetical protein
MRRYKEQEMRRLHAKWQESGKTKVVFCKEEGIIKSTFYYWAKKLQGSRPGKTMMKTNFTPLVLDQNIPPTNPLPFFRINYGSGISIDFFGSVDAGFIKEPCQ